MTHQHEARPCDAAGITHQIHGTRRILGSKMRVAPTWDLGEAVSHIQRHGDDKNGTSSAKIILAVRRGSCEVFICPFVYEKSCPEMEDISARRPRGKEAKSI